MEGVVVVGFNVGKSDARVFSTGNHARINKGANTERKWDFPQPADSDVA
jgi:hypothetical protein